MFIYIRKCRYPGAVNWMHLQNYIFYLPAKRESSGHSISTCKCHCALAISCEALGPGWWTLLLWRDLFHSCSFKHIPNLCEKSKPSTLLITTSPDPGPQLHPHLVVKVGQAQKIGPYSWPFCRIFFRKKKPGWFGWYSHQPPKKNLETSVMSRFPTPYRMQSSGLPSRWPDLLDRRAYMEKFGDLIVMWSFSGITATDRTFGVYRVNLTVWNTHTTKGWSLLRPSCCKDEESATVVLSGLILHLYKLPKTAPFQMTWWVHAKNNFDSTSK